MDTLGDEEKKNEDWISNLVKEFANVKKEEWANKLEEPNNSTVQNESSYKAPELRLMEGTKTKRAVEEEDVDSNVVKTKAGSLCMKAAWRCLSEMLEGGVRNIHSTEGVLG